METTTTLAEVTAADARHTLWHYGATGGWQPGTFTEHLLRALDSADLVHRARLSIVYPGLATAVRVAKDDNDGIARLQAIAAGGK